MDFKEYILSLPNANRLAILKGISKHGDPNEILNELFCTAPCVSNKKYDIRVSDGFLLLYKKKSLFSDNKLYLYKLSDYKYCYHIEETGIGGCSIVLMSEGGNVVLRNGLGISESVAVFEELNRRITGFADTPSTFGGEKNDTLIYSSPKNPTVSYHVINHQLVSVKNSLFKEPNGYVIVDDIDKIMWCTQYFSPDGDSDDVSALELYVLGKKKPERLFGDTPSDNFKTALALKDHIPHLLYGHNREYERLFKENPEALMELAKKGKK